MSPPPSPLTRGNSVTGHPDIMRLNEGRPRERDTPGKRFAVAPAQDELFAIVKQDALPARDTHHRPRRHLHPLVFVTTLEPGMEAITATLTDGTISATYVHDLKSNADPYFAAEADTTTGLPLIIADVLLSTPSPPTSASVTSPPSSPLLLPPRRPPPRPPRRPYPAPRLAHILHLRARPSPLHPNLQSVLDASLSSPKRKSNPVRIDEVLWSSRFRASSAVAEPFVHAQVQRIVTDEAARWRAEREEAAAPDAAQGAASIYTYSVPPPSLLSQAPSAAPPSISRHPRCSMSPPDQTLTLLTPPTRFHSPNANAAIVPQQKTPTPASTHHPDPRRDAAHPYDADIQR
ncbi:hypothetical protein B0H11DRAFT_2259103 [Mycena galericulata]|nr:hypothetical protein B0H11DRAFT_2259103 [Mycena galericulata]